MFKWNFRFIWLFKFNENIFALLKVKESDIVIFHIAVCHTYAIEDGSPVFAVFAFYFFLNLKRYQEGLKSLFIVPLILIY